MQAMHIAAERGLPKELLQRVQLLEVLPSQSFEFEYNSFTEFHPLLTFDIRHYVTPYFLLSLKSARIE